MLRRRLVLRLLPQALANDGVHQRAAQLRSQRNLLELAALVFVVNGLQLGLRCVPGQLRDLPCDGTQMGG